MQDIIDWWINYKPLCDEETKTLHTLINDCPNETGFFTDIEKEFFGLIPASNLTQNNSKLYFSKTATDFIKYLFNEYVIDKTLIISTQFEHENVKKELSLRNNDKILLNFHEGKYDIDFNKIAEKAKAYSNVFIYIIGTQISTGEMTPQQLIIDLKNALLKNGINFKIVLDDVHGIFITPRDYSIFDYVLNTGHALIPLFDLGMLLVNNGNKSFGMQDYSLCKNYLNRLKMMLDRKDKLFDFYRVMEIELQQYLNNPLFGLVSYVTPNIFAFKINKLRFTDSMKKKLDEVYIRIEDANDSVSFARMRAQNYIVFPESFRSAVELLKKFFDLLISTYSE